MRAPDAIIINLISPASIYTSLQSSDLSFYPVIAVFIYSKLECQTQTNTDITTDKKARFLAMICQRKIFFLIVKKTIFCLLPRRGASKDWRPHS